MFGRLLKHQLKSTWKEFCILYGILILLGFLLGVAIATENEIFVTLIGILYGFSIFAIVIIFFVYLFRINSTSTYGKQGYLTFSLPVSSHGLILSKVLTMVIYAIGMSLSFAISFLLVFLLVSPETAKSLISSISDVLWIAVQNPLAALVYAVYSLVCLVTELIIIQFAFAAANTGISKNKRWLMAIVFFVGIQIVLTFLSAFDPIHIIVAMDQNAQLIAVKSNGYYIDGYYLFSVWDMILQVILLLGLYFATVVLIDKKLELE